MKYISFYWFLLLIFTAFSCESYQLEKEPEAEILEGISFRDSIVPIFNKDCSTSGCHSSGGIPPDLSELNAYNSLVYGDYVDTIVPEQSKIYQRMTDNVRPMPTDGLLPLHERSLVLTWITDGAQKN